MFSPSCSFRDEVLIRLLRGFIAISPLTLNKSFPLENSSCPGQKKRRPIPDWWWRKGF
jgi:hypothetical protein